MSNRPIWDSSVSPDQLLNSVLDNTNGINININDTIHAAEELRRLQTLLKEADVELDALETFKKKEAEDLKIIGAFEVANEVLKKLTLKFRSETNPKNIYYEHLSDVFKKGYSQHKIDEILPNFDPIERVLARKMSKIYIGKHNLASQRGDLQHVKVSHFHAMVIAQNEMRLNEEEYTFFEDFCWRHSIFAVEDDERETKREELISQIRTLVERITELAKPDDDPQRSWITKGY